MRDGRRVLRRNIRRERSVARRVIERENAGGYGQRRLEGLEKVLQRARVGCRGGKLRPERGWREADIRIAATAHTRSVFVVPR
jgi:hypothetical protein